MMIASLIPSRRADLSPQAEGLDKYGRGSGWRTACAATVLAGSAMILAGCISVSAPDKPIVIELNINIKQEVIYRLAADAANTIESNPDIF